MTDSTDAKIRVRIGGQETDITPTELAQKYAALEQHAQQLSAARQQTDGILELIRTDPTRAIQLIHGEATRKGINVVLPAGEKAKPQSRVDDDGYYDDNDDQEGDEMSGQYQELQAQLAAATKEIETLKLRNGLTDGIKSESARTGIDELALRQYVVEHNVEPALAARLMQADALLAKQQEQDTLSQADAEKQAAAAARTAEIEAMMTGRDGISPMGLSDNLVGHHVTEDGKLDQAALIRDAMAANNVPVP